MATRRSCSRQGVSVVLLGLTPRGREGEREAGGKRSAGEGGEEREREIGQVQAHIYSRNHTYTHDRSLAVSRHTADRGRRT